MDLDALAPLVRDIGISGVLLLIVMLRLEPKVDAVTRAVEGLTDAVQLHVVAQTRPGLRDDPRGKRP